MVPAIPGYDQVRDFYKRFADKMSDATIGLGFDFSKVLSQNPAAGQALNDMAGEMQKLQGVPIMQVMRMGTTVNGQPLPAASEAPLPPTPAPLLPAPARSPKPGISSMIPGHFGFGKKKNNPPDPDLRPEQHRHPGPTHQRHPHGNPDHHIELLIGSGRSLALRNPRRLQTGPAAGSRHAKRACFARRHNPPIALSGARTDDSCFTRQSSPTIELSQTLDRCGSAEDSGHGDPALTERKRRDGDDIA